MKILPIHTEALRYFGYTEEEAQFLYLVSSVPTLCEQNQLVIGNALNFVGHRLCK